MVLFCIAFLEERECVEKLGRTKKITFLCLSFFHAIEAKKAHLISSKSTKVL